MADTLRATGRVPEYALSLRSVLAEAFDDPSLEVAFPHDGGWAAADGRPLLLGEDRRVTEVHDGDELVAAIVHDDAPAALVEAGVAMARVVLENQRLAAEAAASLREVSESRARLSASAERERRRIERDLHDGAQQRLVALRIELELGRGARAARPRARARTGCTSSSTTSTRRSRSCARSPTASTRRCSPTAGWPRRCAPPPRARGCTVDARRARRRAATRPRSRAPSTSAAWRRCRTRSSTRAGATRAVDPPRRRAPRASCASRCATTAPARRRRDHAGHRDHEHARPPGGDRRRRERELLAGRDDRPRPRPGGLSRSRARDRAVPEPLQRARRQLLLAHARRDVA